MRKKLRLDVERLAVESFEPERDAEEGRGTVRAHGPACTCAASCDCKTAIYWCAEIAWTVYSCDYTANESCYHTRVPCTAD
jgi:hypothetical protein